MKTIYKRGTEKTHPCFEVLTNEGKYIGYVIKNTSQFARIGENWNFVSKSDTIGNLYADTKNNLLRKLKELIQ